MADGPKKRGCLKLVGRGCGCVVVVSLLSVIALAAIGYFQRPGPEKVEEVSATHAVSETGEAASTREAPFLPPESQGVTPPGRLVLDFQGGRFDLRPVAAGEPVSVEARYDAATSELTESFDQADDGSWIQTVRFRQTVGFFAAIFGGSRTTPVVEVKVPRGTAVEITGSITQGQSRVHLGGLELQRVALEVGQGQHEVRIDEPTTGTLTELSVRGSMGQVRVSGLGNASPQAARIEHSMGQLDVDLAGPWRNDSHVSVRFQFGQCQIRSAPDVPLVVEVAHVDGGEVVGAPAPGDTTGETRPAHVVRLEATGTGGELVFR